MSARIDPHNNSIDRCAIDMNCSNCNSDVRHNWLEMFCPPNNKYDAMTSRKDFFIIFLMYRDCKLLLKLSN